MLANSTEMQLAIPQVCAHRGRMKRIPQLDILARALIGGLVDLYGSRHAAHVLHMVADRLANTGETVAETQAPDDSLAVNRRQLPWEDHG
jgi:hypothetical protein